RLVRPETAVVHAVEDTEVHGLEAVAHNGQRAAHDDGHRLVEVAALHLGLQVDLVDAAVLVDRLGAFFVSHVSSLWCLWFGIADAASLAERVPSRFAGPSRCSLTRHPQSLAF